MQSVRNNCNHHKKKLAEITKVMLNSEKFNTHSASLLTEEDLQKNLLSTLTRSINSQFQGIKLHDIQHFLDARGVTLLSLKPAAS